MKPLVASGAPPEALAPALRELMAGFAVDHFVGSAAAEGARS